MNTTEIKEIRDLIKKIETAATETERRDLYKQMFALRAQQLRDTRAK